MSMATVEGIVPRIRGQPAPALTPDFTPDFSITFLEEICPTCPTCPTCPICPSDAPSLRPSQGPSDVPSQSPSITPAPVVGIGKWVTPVDDDGNDFPWSIVQCDDAPGGPSMCYQAFDSKSEEPDSPFCQTQEEVPVVDTDVEVRGKKKKSPVHPDGVEAIMHDEYTTLQNTFTFPDDGFLAFDLFCSSERFVAPGGNDLELGDFCIVLVDNVQVIKESGNLGWRKKAIAVSKGPSTIQWKYDKDDSCTSYEDTMKLDNIQFIQLASSGGFVVDVDNFEG